MGPKCIAGLRAFIRIIIAHANNCCPKCDVSRREGTTLLAHAIDMHVSAGFSAVDLLNSLFMDNSSNFELVLYFCFFVDIVLSLFVVCLLGRCS